MDYLEIIKARRSVYDIGKDIDLFDQELINLLKYNLKHTPSSFNAQSQRIVLLLNDSHDKFWKVVLAALKKVVPEENFARTEKKINGFSAGYGTVLFFDDYSVTSNLMEKYPLYKQNTVNWSYEQNGMLQLNVWQSLMSKDIGASLQHYTELVEEEVKSIFDIPSDWKMIAQMPFGNIISKPFDKPKIPVEDRIIIHK